MRGSEDVGGWERKLVGWKTLGGGGVGWEEEEGCTKAKVSWEPFRFESGESDFISNDSYFAVCLTTTQIILYHAFHSRGEE